MPKRIMSAKKSSSKISASVKAISEKMSNNATIEQSQTALKREPKDRSALVGLKRTRKSRDQIYKL